MSRKSKQVMILLVQGGAGDVLAATPMIRSWKKTHPTDKMVVMATYSQLLEENEYIDKLLPLNDVRNVYERFVVNKEMGEVRFFKKHFVYDKFCDTPRFKSSSLPEFICKCYDTDYDGEPLDYMVTDEEKACAETFVSQFQKPVVLVHAVGSIPSDGQPNKVHKLKDLNQETTAALIEKHKEHFDFVQIGLTGEPLIPGVLDGLGIPMREAMALIPLCKTFIFIESIFAHCANAFEKAGVVVFNNTDPKFFGYKSAVNISHGSECDIWPCNRPVGALMDFKPGYLDPKTRVKPLWDCPNFTCNKHPLETLESAFLRATKMNEPIQPPANSLEEARKQ